MDKSDLILRLVPQNRFSSEICRVKENYNHFCEISGYPLLALRFSYKPKDVKTGFVFGHDKNSCDIIFKEPHTSRRHFSITFNPNSGLILLLNGSTSGTVVGSQLLSSFNQSIVLNHEVLISFGIYRFIVDIPARNHAQERFLHNQSLYLGNMLCNTPTTVFSKVTTPNHAMKKIGPYFEVSQLGEGGFGKLSLLCRRDNGDLFVAKTLHNLHNDKELKYEAWTLGQLSHVCIIFQSTI